MSRQMFADILSLIARLRRCARRHVGQREQMRQAAIREVCPCARDSAGFSVSVQPTACLDRLLLAARAIGVAQAGQEGDPGFAAAGNLANVRLRGEGRVK